MRGLAFHSIIVCLLGGASGALADDAPVPARGANAAADGASALGNARTVRGGEARGFVAFTFDDGPSAELTPPILDALDDYDVPATFFVVGWRFATRRKQAPGNAAALDEVYRRGHVVGNHTFKHHNLSSLSRERATREIDDTEAAIVRRLGHTPRLFRPPFGALTPHTKSYLSRRGYTTVRWNIDAKDYRERDSAQVRAKTVQQILEREGGIVLLHDTKPWTSRAVAGILDDLESENCRRLEIGEFPILPVSIHYFLRESDGSQRTIPTQVAARTERYKNQLPSRCRSRIDKADRPQ